MSLKRLALLGCFPKEKISQAIQLGRMLLGRLSRKASRRGLDQGSLAAAGLPPKDHMSSCVQKIAQHLTFSNIMS